MPMSKSSIDDQMERDGTKLNDPLVIEVKHAPRYMPSTENRKKKQR
jgi:hypothetical protein